MPGNVVVIACIVGSVLADCESTIGHSARHGKRADQGTEQIILEKVGTRIADLVTIRLGRITNLLYVQTNSTCQNK